MRKDDLAELYQDAAGDDILRPDPDLVRRREKELRMRLHRRNILEAFASGMTAAIFGVHATAEGSSLSGIGAAAIATGALLVMVILLFRGVAPEASPAVDTRRYLEDYRRELRYQARLLRWTPVWYLGPFIPGLGIYIAARLVEGSPARAATLAVAVSTCFLGVGILNWVSARRLEERARHLPSLHDAA